MTALFKKLNLKDQSRIVVLDAPASFDAELAQLAGVTVHTALRASRDESFALAFVITQDVLDRHSAALVPPHRVHSEHYCSTARLST